MQRKISVVFWVGAGASFVGFLLILASMWGMMPESSGEWGVLMLIAGVPAMTLGLIAKGVEWGVRAANDE